MPMERKEHELHVAVKQADGHQQAEDAAKAAVERSRRTSSEGASVFETAIESQRRRGRSQHRNRVEARHPVGIVKALEEASEKPQREQLEQRVRACQGCTKL